MFRYSHPEAYINGHTNLTLLAEALRESQAVFYLGNIRIAVGLASDFHAHSENNFLADASDIPRDGDLDRLQKFLQTNQIVYDLIPADYPGEVVSPDGRFIARADGLYLVETGQKIVGRIYHVEIRGWTSDSTGVIYSEYYRGPCLLEINPPLGDGLECLIWVPQPVLKLKVPEENLLPTQTP